MAGRRDGRTIRRYPNTRTGWAAAVAAVGVVVVVVVGRGGGPPTAPAGGGGSGGFAAIGAGMVGARRGFPASLEWRTAAMGGEGLGMGAGSGSGSVGTAEAEVEMVAAEAGAEVGLAGCRRWSIGSTRR